MNNKELLDGIYLVQADGSKVPFTGKNNEQERTGCKYIGLKLGTKSICIALKDAAKGYTPLMSEEVMTNGYGNYFINSCNATADWNGKKNTELLKKAKLSKNIHLEDGEYIPSAGELKFIQLFRKQIQEAFKFVGKKMISDEWYWTSTGSSLSYAWRLNVGDDFLSAWNDKGTDTTRVRAVKEF